MSDRPPVDSDLTFLQQLHDRFLKSRLGQVPGISLMGTLIGKLLAAAERHGVNWFGVVVGNLPTSIEVARSTWGLTPEDEAAIRYCEAHGAEHVTEMAARMKAQIGATVTGALRENLAPQETAKRLMAEYGALNRDWRRMALTETATAVANGYLAQQAPGTLVVGDSAVDCCDWCREFLQGRVYRMLPAPPEAPTEEESLTCVWVGKSNVGRSKYPVRQDGTPRGHGERWHPCIPAHPHCRCRWRQFSPGIEKIEPGSNKVVDLYDVWGKN